MPLFLIWMAHLTVSVRCCNPSIRAGLWFAFGSLALGGCWSALCVRLARSGSDRDARRVFLASLVYLPLVLALMVVDR
jgi:heme O synthase-like polyprenyltransferase